MPRQAYVSDQFRLLVEEVKDFAIFMLSPDGIVSTWNDGATRIKQWKADEIIGQNYRILYRQEDQEMGRPERNIRLAIENGRHEEEWWRVRKDGTLFWAEAVHTPIYNAEGKLIGVAKTVRDLTERKKAEEALRKAKEDAERANQAKTTFIANISHEIRTPLNAILGFVDLLKDPGVSNEEKSLRSEIVERNAEVLTRLIDDLLDFSKIESGKIDFEITQVPVRNLVSEIVAIFEEKARAKGLGLEAFVAENVPEYINSDAVRVRQVVSNIIGNAVKFTSEGGIKVFVNPLVRESAKTPNGVEIRVKDTGPGLTNEQAERLFSPFTQADNSVTRKFGGTGLGLALSRRLARDLGGDVTISKCAEAHGCEFVITFSGCVGPAKKETPRAPAVPHASEAEAAALRDLRVLVAEDSADNQLFLHRLLDKFGMRATFVNDGSAAIHEALRSDYDLILMDIQMPNTDGNSATRELRAKGYQKPIVALTAHALLEEKTKAFASGCDDYLTKPISKQRLLDALVRVSGGARRATPTDSEL